ncbi:hypothetical protein [Reyranella sp.]
MSAVLKVVEKDGMENNWNKIGTLAPTPGGLFRIAAPDWGVGERGDS